MADTRIVTIRDIALTDDTLTMDLSDGRSISAPLAWYLGYCTARQKNESLAPYWRRRGHSLA